jgi:UDP-3-O-[3-hydroxymyristoyl] N-acetylglucosamine deacetylase
MGDLYLAGHQLLAEYDGFKSGHAMNNQLVRALLAQQQSWEWATFENERPSPLNWPLPHTLQLV